MDSYWQQLLSKGLKNAWGNFYIITAHSTPQEEKRARILHWMNSLLEQYYLKKYPGALGGRLARLKHPDIQIMGEWGQEKNENYTQEEFAHFFQFLSFRPFEAEEKILLVLDAHKIGDLLANKLLKSLEDTPLKTTIFFLVPSSKSLLPTLISRGVSINIEEGIHRPPQVIGEAPPFPQNASNELKKLWEDFQQRGIGLHSLCLYLKNSPEEQHFILQYLIDSERNRFSDYVQKEAFLKMLQADELAQTFHNSVWGRFGGMLLLNKRSL